MSVAKRLVSGSAASWASVLVTVVTQIALVPIFLKYWTVEAYGYWLMILTISTLATLCSISYQHYTGFELLKIGQQPKKLMHLYSAVQFSVFIVAILELTILAIAAYSGMLDPFFGSSDQQLNPKLLQQAKVSLIVNSIGWMMGPSVSGLASRVLFPYGYFARFAWWNVLIAICTAITSTMAVSLGANILQTMLVNVATILFIYIFLHWDIWRLFHKYQLHLQKPDMRLAWQTFLHSLGLAFTNISDLLRQQGIRMFLSSVVGVTKMTAFSTMRTLSNVSLQGIGTVVNPVMPEFMRYLRMKDTQKSIAIMGFIWFFAVILLSPIMIVFQLIMPYIFKYWTHGKIVYDSVLFGTLSVALLIYALARPAAAILQGNNLVKTQFVIALSTSVLAVLGVILFSPYFGIRAAGYSLLVAELIATTATVVAAIRWMKQHHVEWPQQLFAIATISLLVSLITIVSFEFLEDYKIVISLFAFAIETLIAGYFLLKLPNIAKEKMRKVLAKMKLIKSVAAAG